MVLDSKILSLILALELLKTATDRRKAKREVVKDKAGNQAVFLTLR